MTPPWGGLVGDVGVTPLQFLDIVAPGIPTANPTLTAGTAVTYPARTPPQATTTTAVIRSEHPPPLLALPR